VAKATRSGLAPGSDGEARCFWCAGDPLYEAYHDDEWGFPVGDDVRLFEKICLESAVNDARRTLELVEARGSLALHLWEFEPSAGERPKRITWPALGRLTETPASRALSKDLRKCGFSLVGPPPCTR
jgi:DNA-3-methyladenine glycosylase I